MKHYTIFVSSLKFCNEIKLILYDKFEDLRYVTTITQGKQNKISVFSQVSGHFPVQTLHELCKSNSLLLSIKNVTSFDR